MTGFLAVFRRELRAFFLGPLAYVFIGVYILISGLATWNIARLFDTARVDLSPFFQFQPWILAVLAPAIGMRLWSEDLRSRTAQLYLASPLPLLTVHLAKALAGFCVLLLALMICVPYWLAMTWLGAPDHGVIALSLFHIACLGLVFLLVAMAFSAMTRHQVVALVLSVATCLLLLVLGLNLVTTGLGSSIPGFVTDWLSGFSLFEPVRNASRGILSLTDLLIYFGLGALAVTFGIFFINQTRLVGQRSSAKYWRMSSLALLVIGFPIARGLVQESLTGVRADVTGYRLNTLSPSAEALASSLREPVDLTLYYSSDIGQDYPEIRAHAERVEALLRALEQSSNDKIRLKFSNPRPFSQSEDEAILYGISAIPTEGVDPLYFGLVGRNRVDDTQTLPFLSPDQDPTLEFDVSRLLSGLDRLETPTIGILSGISALSATANEQEKTPLQKAIEAEYRIGWITPQDFALPTGMKLLIIAQPPDVSAHTRYLLDRFISAGGRVLVLADKAPLLHERTVSDQLTDWMSDWGVSLSEQILAEPELGLAVSVQTVSGPQAVRQPVFPALGSAQINRNDFLTAPLQNAVHFGAAGWLIPDPGRKTQFTPLISSSSEAEALNAEAYLQSDQSPAFARANMSPLNNEVVVAARVSGAMTAGENEPPKPQWPDDPVLRRLAEAEWQEAIEASVQLGQAEIVVIADTDFLYPAFYLNPQTGAVTADNEALVMSVLDQFAGNPDLASLRARPPTARPMTRVIEMRRAAEEEYLSRQQELETRLGEIESRLNPSGASNPGVQADYLNIRKDLRDLQADFRRRIDNLEAWLRWITVWIPAALAFLASAGIVFLTRGGRK